MVKSYKHILLVRYHDARKLGAAILKIEQKAFWTPTILFSLFVPVIYVKFAPPSRAILAQLLRR